MFTGVVWAVQATPISGITRAEKASRIVSKDSDFAERSVLLGSPPKVIWLRAANCTTLEIESLLRNGASLVTRFMERDEETCLVLGPKRALP